MSVLTHYVLFSEGIEIIEDSSIFEAMYYSNRHAFGKLARNKQYENNEF